jgi:hypothetical protein
VITAIDVKGKASSALLLGRSAVLVACGLVWLLAIAPSAAKNVAGVYLHDYVQTRAGVLERVLCSVRHTLWIEHYVSAVYVPGGASLQALRDRQSAKAVLLHMIETRYLPPEIPRKWRRALQMAVDRDAMSKVRGAYQGLRNGDVLAIVYTPRDGVSLSLNGEALVTARGHGVIDSLLATWRGQESLREKLERAEREHECLQGG